jgi:uncharacterized membrane protein
MRYASAAALFGMVVTCAGCSQESTPGGPGASSTPARSSTTTTTSTPTTATTSQSVTTTANKPVIIDKNNTFTLKVPEMTTTVNQGKKEDVTISINRGSAFKESVKLQFRAPKGMTITPAEPVIHAGQDKVTVSIQATTDAPAGKNNIEVTAVPESGRSVSLEMPVQVKH